MQIDTMITWPFTCSCSVVSVLTSPLHVPVRAPTRSLLSRIIRPAGYFVSSILQLTANACESFHSHLSLYFYHLPQHHFIHN